MTYSGDRTKVTGSAPLEHMLCETSALWLELHLNMKCTMICSPCASWANSELDLRNMRTDTVLYIGVHEPLVLKSQWKDF